MGLSIGIAGSLLCDKVGPDDCTQVCQQYPFLPGFVALILLLRPLCSSSHCRPELFEAQRKPIPVGTVFIAAWQMNATAV